MRNEVAQVKNIRLVLQTVRELQQRAPGVPGMGLWWGKSGFGKTTAAAWLVNQVHGIYLRAVETWTPHAMLSAFMNELGAAPMSRSNPMLTFIVESVRVSGRPVFIDEADYVVKKGMLNTLRDLHDLSTVPVILIGMQDFRQKVTHREQLTGRIARWTEFCPADFKDACELAKTVCEVEVGRDLLERLHRDTSGSMRGMTVGLSHIENFGKRTGKSPVTSKDWGSREFTLPIRSE